MPDSMWKSQAVEEAQLEVRADEQPKEHVDEAAAEPRAESNDVTLSVDEFSALEERILRAVNLVKQERQARMAAEERATKAEIQIGNDALLLDRLQAEIETLRAERGNVRQRVERLLAQLDALEL
jgi:hypothetical protein